MFRSQIDHHQGDTIFVLTSVTKFNFTGPNTHITTGMLLHQ